MTPYINELSQQSERDKRRKQIFDNARQSELRIRRLRSLFPNQIYPLTPLGGNNG